MHVIRLENITINHAGRVIFQGLSWAIDDRDRVGLVGPNGAGKSSLLKAITGEVIPDAGSVIRLKEVRVGYLPQNVQFSSGKTLFDEAMILPPRLARVEAELAKIDDQLGDPDIYGNDAALTRVLDRQRLLWEEFDHLGGAQHGSKVREILSLLGFAPNDYGLKVEHLSGGQKKLLALTKLAVESPDVLLLDEPDNHLDLQAKRYLENFIRHYAGAVIIVSHDRYLLDEVATQIAELADGALTLYPGNYTAYAAERELRRLRQQQLYAAQQKEIARIEAAIKRFEHWARITEDNRHTRQANHRRKMLERMEANGEMIDQIRESRRTELQISGWRGSNKALEVKDLTMGFDSDLLFLELNFLIRHGERVGLIGPNGAGKSVLFNLILGQLPPLEGDIVIGPSTRIGYYAQEYQTLADWLDRTPLELVRNINPTHEGAAVAFLLKFLFTYEQTRQPIRTLSGGERSRLQLAALMLQKPNLLLLDEPTNNLDIPSVEVLESTLEDFEGAVLVISHDRYFLDQVVDRVFELKDGTLQSYEGGYTDYLEAVKAKETA